MHVPGRADASPRSSSDAFLPRLRHRTVKPRGCDEKIAASVNKALPCQPESSAVGSATQLIRYEIPVLVVAHEMARRLVVEFEEVLGVAAGRHAQEAGEIVF